MKIIEKRILFVPVNGVGHVNACIGIAKPMIRRGHRIAFFVEKTYKGKIKKLGFEEYYYEPSFFADKKDIKNIKNPGESAAQWLVAKCIIGNTDIIKQLEKLTEIDDSLNDKRLEDLERLKEVIELFKPDLFIVDNITLEPVIDCSDKPWIKIMSVAPLIYLHNFDHLPPAWTGLSFDSNRKEWPKYREIVNRFIYSKENNDFNEKHGYRRYEDDLLMPLTQAMTIYAYPEEYDYPEIKEHHPDWFNLEVFNKNDSGETVDLKEFLPKEFYDNDLDGNFTGKWIYVSMGSMGSVDLDLMHRLIDALSKTNHKYIVSKGPRHEEYELKRNLWGDRYLPQTKILPIVDLVITHGGNNSVTETFAQGKPMIIMPLFCDQHDNAQRLSEKKLAIKIPPYDFTDEQLIESIDRLIYDDELNSRLKQASQRILSIDKHEQVCDKIEDIMAKYDNDCRQKNENFIKRK
nr:UDP-glycosyltransferase UGT4-like [Dermatophagoides farinae]